MRYRLVNKTDGILASPETFKSQEAAAAAAEKLRERFRSQGHYLTTDGKRIAPDQVLFAVVPADEA